MVANENNATTRRIALYIEFNESFTGGPRLAANLVQSLAGGDLEPILFTNRESELTEAVARAGCEVSIVKTPEFLCDSGRRTWSVLSGLRTITAVLKLNLALFRKLKEYDVELVWTRNIKGVCFVGLAAIRHRVPIVWDVGMELPSKGLVFFLHLFGFLAASAVVIQGKHVGDFVFHPWLLKAFGRKLAVVPSSIAHERVSALQRTQNDIEPRSNVFKIVSVGTVNRRKDQLTLVKAFSRISNEFPNVQIEIAGPITDDKYASELVEYICVHGLNSRVILTGWVEDVPSLLKSSDLFVLTSRNEGVPQAVMEAMIAGVPVIATRVGGVPDVIAHAKTGYLVDIGDDEALANQLRECLADQPRLKVIAQAASSWILENRSMENWEMTYRQLLGRLLHRSS